MIVEKVRDVTTTNSPVSYEVTIRIWADDLTTQESDLEFAALARKAVNGIACYPIERKNAEGLNSPRARKKIAELMKRS